MRKNAKAHREPHLELRESLMAPFHIYQFCIEGVTIG
jgi:hypothetical protein